MSWKNVTRRENVKERLIHNVNIYEASIGMKFKKMNFKLVNIFIIGDLNKCWQGEG